MNKPRIEDKNGIATVIGKDGEKLKEFTTKDHGKSYLSAAQLWLQQNYDKCMQEEVELLEKAPSRQSPRLRGAAAGVVGALAARYGNIAANMMGITPKGKKLVPTIAAGAAIGAMALRAAKKHNENVDKLNKFKVGNKVVAQHEDGNIRGNVVDHSIEDSNPLVHVKDHDGVVHKIHADNVQNLESKKKKLDESSHERLKKYRDKAKEDVEARKQKGKKVQQAYIDAGLKYAAMPFDPKLHKSKSREYYRNLAAAKMVADTPLGKAYGVKVPATEETSKEELMRKYAEKKNKEENKEKGKHHEMEKKNLRYTRMEEGWGDDPEDEGPRKAIEGILSRHVMHHPEGLKLIRHGLPRVLDGIGHVAYEYSRGRAGHGISGSDTRAFIDALHSHFGEKSPFAKNESFDKLEERTESAVEGFKNGIIHRFNMLHHKESGHVLMHHLLIKHGFNKVNDAINSAAGFHGEGAEEIGSSDITAAANSALSELGHGPLKDIAEYRNKQESVQQNESSGDAPTIKQMSHGDLADYINKHPKWVEKNREEAEEIAHEKTEDLKEVAPPGREEQVKALKGKVDNPYAVAWASYNKGKKTQSENKMLSNILTRLEEEEKKGPGRPAKEEEKIGIHPQLLKHRDVTVGTGMIKFDDGSSHKISPEHREKALKVLGSLVGPGKNPDKRDQINREMGSSYDQFMKHIGVK